MSWQDEAKKQVEGIALDGFFDAYEHATGQNLSVLAAGENPDFVCARPDGTPVGLELTQVRRDRDIARAERILERKDEMDPYEMLEFTLWQLGRKEKARVQRYTQSVPQTMLVFQLVDGSLSPAFCRMLEGLEDDFADHGFSEVWLADYSGVDAYGDIELFGVYPQEIYGHYERPMPDRKPYG